jgi:serine/arginine repetitive matrix protein 2
MANQSNTLNVIPPRAPRSMRGSSSPVETRNGTWHSNGSSSVPSRHIDLPTDIKPDIPNDGDLDLEEGEVVSPVRKPIEAPIASNPIPRQGDRWAPPHPLPPRRRTSFSPQKQPFRSRPVSPVFRDRDRPIDRGWGGNRRTLSPSASRPKSRDRPSSRGKGREWSSNSERIPSGNGDRIQPPNTNSPEKIATQENRPPTPPAAPAAPRNAAPIPSPPVRPNTPLLPEPPSVAAKPSKSPLNQSMTLPLDRPSTPELPPPPIDAPSTTPKIEEEVVQERTEDRPVSPLPVASEEVPTADPLASPLHVVAEEATPLPAVTTIITPIAVEETPILGLKMGRISAKNTPTVLSHRLPPVTVGPTPPDSAPAMTPRIEERRSASRMRFADLPSDVKQDNVEQKIETYTTPNPNTESPDVFGAETVETVVTETLETPNTRTSITSTIAERRAVNLPVNVVPPPRTHAGNRIRKSFPAESIISGQPSPRTEASSAAPSELSEEDRALKVAAAIKLKQKDHPTFGPLFDHQVEIINAETAKTAPRSRTSSETNNVDMIQQVSETMNAKDAVNKPLLEKRLLVQNEERRKRLAKLRREYDLHQRRWEGLHRVLDEQMAERPPMPTRIYEMILFIKEAEELAIIDETSRNRTVRQATQAQLEAVMEQSRLDDELHPNRLADINGVEVPDMLPREERRCTYDDDNDLVEDPLEFYDFAGNREVIWTETEKAIFAKIFPNCQKQFGKIADKLPGKSVGDCVQYYYRTKKDLEWKREPAKGTIAAKKVAKPSAKRGPKPNVPEDDPTPPPTGMAVAGPRGGALAGRGRGRGRASGVSTPGDTKSGRRKASAIDTLVEGQSSETTSRAASETPGAGKGKMRAPKSKRPRESSVLDPTGQSTLANEITETPIVEDPDSELPPTAKRAGKRRKVLGLEGQPIEGEEKGDKRRRAGQNSYWNNEEKAQFAKLSALYPGDFTRIAHELGGTKTVKQVENWSAKVFGEDTKQPVPVPVSNCDYYGS